MFKNDAEQLSAIRSQWYAVSYFYAAFHTVRASLMVDPVFSDLARLKQHNENWTPDDRWNGHHQACGAIVGRIHLASQTCVGALWTGSERI